MGKEQGVKRLSKRTLVAAFFILLIIPLTIFLGLTVLDDRKYYFISMLIIFYTMLPFFMVFEGRKPKARELMVIAVLVAIAVAGRWAFFMLPQFKPVVAIVIIAGVCLGAESGFLVGAMSGFVSNFLFGQGPWTPWQMFSFGIIGFLAGILFKKGLLKKNGWIYLYLCVFGGLSTLLIYGPLMNTQSMLAATGQFTLELLIIYCLSGLPFDLIHAFATVFFLLVLSKPMIEKIERVKIKYGLIE